MISVEVFGSSAAMHRLARTLDGFDGVSRVRCVEAARAGHSVVVAAARPTAVDPLLDELHRHGVGDDDIELSRVEVFGQAVAAPAGTALVWADVLGVAWHNARPVGRYLTFLLVAGVIAGYGVIERNPILIVGAMAVSPDLLPITAVGVGVARRRARLVLEALLTLAAGLGLAALAAALVALAQDQLDVIPSGFTLDAASAALGGLTKVNNETIVVALCAGVAGMLALETRASSAVGVAVSVTTIPAAAYLGVAAGLGEAGTAVGALGLLGANVGMMVIGASLTLAAQSRLRRRALQMPAERSRSSAG
jgi:uncharacterized hydrophobic protein (TIGR00271 family)